MSRFTNAVVWITGASSGIGEALALELARHQAKLVLSSRRMDELQRVAVQTGLPPSHILVLPMDMTDITSLSSHVATVQQHFGRIDYLFQNAGISQRGSVMDTDMSVYKQLMDV